MILVATCAEKSLRGLGHAWLEASLEDRLEIFLPGEGVTRYLKGGIG